MKATNISSESYEQITITSKLQSPENVALTRDKESGQSNLCSNPIWPEITLMDNNLTSHRFCTTPTPKDCEVVVRYNPITDKTYKRYVCSSEGCNNESPLFYLDGHGKCPDCQIIEARAEYIQTEEAVC